MMTPTQEYMSTHTKHSATYFFLFLSIINNVPNFNFDNIVRGFIIPLYAGYL